MASLRIAVVGLRFGADFVPIYLRHPDVARVGLCDLSEEARNRLGDEYGIEDRFATLEEVFAADYDAVHLLTPVRFHVEQTLAALNAGLHVACAVPMATKLEDLHRIVEAERRTGRRYMMMETAVYTREFLYIQDLYRSGQMGALTFMRGSHMQNIEGLPDYWKGYPYMLYATHAVAPILSLAGTRAAKICCFGSGTLREDLQAYEGNRFPLETAIMRLHVTDIAAEVTGSFFQAARPYIESFSAYGDTMGFEWEQAWGESPFVYRMEPYQAGQWGRPVHSQRFEPPFRPDLLPPEIADFTVDGGHGGSHPHLVHEFVRSIVEDRPSAIDAVTAANWTAPGICAHESALREGDPVVVPSFD